MTSCFCCFCVSTSNVGMIESCGKFSHTATPGCGCLIPCVESLRGSTSLKVAISRAVIETKTRDNAVVRIEAHVHHKVIADRAVDAFYRFMNPSEQISSFAANIIRGEVPKYTLDEVFLQSNDIQKAVSAELSEKLSDYGFSLEATLLTSIEPIQSVKNAISLTQVNAYRRTAAEHEAELKKIVAIKSAEADFEEKRLSGIGLAEERKAIMKGLQSSIEMFVSSVPGMSARDVMNLLLMNQYFDAMKEVGNTPNNRIVLLPGGTHNSMTAELMASQVAASSMK